MERRDSQTRHERKLNGPKALAASGLIFMSGAIAACGSNTTETQKPTITPEITPAPSLIMPSESPMVSPTPEITPSPTPEATPSPLTINTIVEGNHPAVKASTVEDILQKTYDENPKAKTVYPTGISDFDVCKTGHPPGETVSTPNTIRSAKEAECKILVANLFLSYIKTGDSNFYDAAKNAYNYAISKNGLGLDYKKELDSYLKQRGLFN